MLFSCVLQAPKTNFKKAKKTKKRGTRPSVPTLHPPTCFYNLLSNTPPPTIVLQRSPSPQPKTQTSLLHSHFSSHQPPPIWLQLLSFAVIYFPFPFLPISIPFQFFETPPLSLVPKPQMMIHRVENAKRKSIETLLAVVIRDLEVKGKMKARQASEWKKR